MVINEKTGFQESIGVTRSTMCVIGLWPLSKKLNLFNRIQFLLPAFVIFFFIILPQTRKAILAQNDLNLMLEVLTTADIIEGIALLKLFGIWYNQQDLKKLVLQIQNDWKSTTAEEQNIMWTYAKLSKLAATFCISSSSGSVFTHAIVFFITINSRIINVNGTTVKPLFLKANFPFDTSYSPVYEIICICQFYGALLSCFAFSSFDGFFVCSILHFSGQLYNLKQRIRNFVTKDHLKKNTFNRALESVVRTHQHLINYTDLIEHNFNKIFLVQMFATSIVLCLQGYQLVLIVSESGTKLLTSLIFILVFTTGNLLSLFMYCYIAQIIQDESQSLFLAVYEMQWYELSPKNANLLLIVMDRLMFPIEITVGKFAAFSLKYFAIVIKTSVGYLSVLLAVKKKLQPESYEF